MTKQTKWHVHLAVDSDQPGHQPSLISVFTRRSLGCQGHSASSGGQRRLWIKTVRMPRLTCVFAWRACHFVGFVVLWLMSNIGNILHWSSSCFLNETWFYSIYVWVILVFNKYFNDGSGSRFTIKLWNKWMSNSSVPIFFPENDCKTNLLSAVSSYDFVNILSTHQFDKNRKKKKRLTLTIMYVFDICLVYL